MKRRYEAAIADHAAHERQMVFLAGPRQVGKTTTARTSLPDARYLDWDVREDRLLILQGARSVARAVGLDEATDRRRFVVFDEIHKFKGWKNFLKGFFDLFSERCGALVTESARLNVYRQGGDSLMGRYFLYRMHPLSAAELTSQDLRDTPFGPPRRVERAAWEHLLAFGGFPEPFLRASARFSTRWQRLREDQLFREDLRDVSKTYDVEQVRSLAALVAAAAGQPVNMSTLSGTLQVSVDTVRRWLSLLEFLHHSFVVRPWFRNVSKAIRRQPKIYLWDWSLHREPGARHENFVASHLLKAVHWWTDTGLGTFALHYLRDKDGREVDFLVTRDDRPWLMVEVKTSSGEPLSRNLEHFAARLGTPHAVQLAFDLPHADVDCLAADGPRIVPACTFLSQLV